MKFSCCFGSEVMVKGNILDTDGRTGKHFILYTPNFICKGGLW